MVDSAHSGRAPLLDRILPFLARDARFTLDRLTVLNRTPGGVLTGRLDLDRTGMFGLSLGGAVTAEACSLESRIRACLMMDVFKPREVLAEGLRQPSMWINRDEPSMRRQGWNPRDIEETQRGTRELYDELPGDGYLVQVPGAFRADFSDLPFFSPLTRKLGLTGPIQPRRVRRIVDDVSRAFFDRHLKRDSVPLLDNPRARFPELLFQSRRSS